MNTDMWSDKIVVVEMGDPRSGKGWVRHQDPQRPKALEEFWRAAERGNMQPHPELKDTRDYPLWGLRVVEVGRDPYLCFTVQGVGPGFGGAGGCQFVFAPTRMHPAELWNGCISSLDDNGRLRTDIHEGHAAWLEHQDTEADVQRMREIAIDLLADHDFITVEGDPGEVGWSIAQLLRLLPPANAMTRSWWTCALKREQAGHSAVSGRWPPAFQSRRKAGEVDRTFPARTGGTHRQIPGRDGEDADGDRRSAALDLFLGELRNLAPQEVSRRPNESSFAETIRRIVLDELVEERDVPELLRTEDGRERLRSMRGVTAGFAAGSGKKIEVMKLMVKIRPDVIGRELTAELLEGAADGAEQQRDLTGLAPKPALKGQKEPVQGWHDVLPSALREAYPDQKTLIEKVCTLLVATGRPLGGRPSLEAAHDWLRTLGLTAESAPDLFPLRSGWIADRLRDGRSLDPETRGRLEDARDVEKPGDELGRVAQHLGPDDFTAVQRLLVVGLHLHDHRGGLEISLDDVFGTILDKSRTPPAALSRLLCGVLDEASRRAKITPATRIAVARAGLARIADSGQDPSPELAVRFYELWFGIEEATWHPGEREAFTVLLEAAKTAHAPLPAQPSPAAPAHDGVSGTVSQPVAPPAGTEEKTGRRKRRVISRGRLTDREPARPPQESRPDGEPEPDDACEPGSTPAPDIVAVGAPGPPAGPAHGRPSRRRRWLAWARGHGTLSRREKIVVVLLMVVLVVAFVGLLCYSLWITAVAPSGVGMAAALRTAAVRRAAGDRA